MKPSWLDWFAGVVIVLVPLAFLWLVGRELLSLVGRLALALSGVGP